MNVKDYYRVTVSDPRPRDGANLYLVVRAPHSLAGKNGKVRVERISSGTAIRAEANAKAAQMQAHLNAQLAIARPGGLGPDPSFLDAFDAHFVFIQTVRKAAEKGAPDYCYGPERSDCVLTW